MKHYKEKNFAESLKIDMFNSQFFKISLEMIDHGPYLLNTVQCVIKFQGLFHLK
jgi:hypothetical protein